MVHESCRAGPNFKGSVVMGNKIGKAAASVLLAGLAAVLVAAPAGANRGNPPPTTTTTEPAYVPPPKYGQNPTPELPDDPYANPVSAPTVVSVDLPAVTDPDGGPAGGGDRLGPTPTDAPADNATVLAGSESRPKAPTDGGGFMGGVLSRTGAETLPLARAGLAALALGLGLVALARSHGSRRVSAK